MFTCMCAHVSGYMCITPTYVYVCTCIHVYASLSVCIYICVYLCVPVCVRKCVCTCVYVEWGIDVSWFKSLDQMMVTFMIKRMTLP